MFSYLYQNTISRLSSGMGGVGPVGKHEARLWHRRAYAGLGEVARMMPQEIGYAAAYEAYRQLKYSSSVYNNVYSDFERQRETQRAIAVAEASRLWQDAGRGMDQFGLQMACDAAAVTAGNIAVEREMEESQGYGMGHGGGSFRDRRNSVGAYSASGYAGSAYGGGGSAYGGGGSAYGGSPLMIGGNLPGTPRAISPIPIPGSPYGGYAGSVGMPGSYSTGGYAGSYGSYGSPGYDNFLGVGGYPPMAGYPMSAPGTPGAIVIHQPESNHRRHRHRHHHHHHRRHRSHDRY